jgi:tight adherence protein B
LAPGEVVAVLVALEASVGAGRSLPQALDLVARERPGVAGRDLAVVAGRVARGEPVVAALDRWAAARPGTGVDVAADAVAIASATGAPLGPALRTAAGGVRARAAAAREARALAASARASAAVLVAAPLAFAVAVAALDRSVRAYLVSTPAGWACLGLGLALDAVGARWMASMVEAVR